MSMFNEAHDFTVIGSGFHIHNQYGQSGIDILREASSPGAAMDSWEHYDRRCFHGTREQYVDDITNWAAAFVDTPPSIYWMRGPAGVGKSAIAQTCAEKLKETGNLGAAFFFTVKKHNNPLYLFTTIAYQLAATLPDYRAAIDDRISKDKTLVEKKISSQFESLIVKPLQELEKQGKGVGRRAVFIDGLDECAGKDAQAEIIKVIASSVRDRSTPFRWAIFSRAEPRIVSTFTQGSIISITHFVELSISREADGEIEMYLRGEFKNILQSRDCLSLSWPTDEDIKTLVGAAAGLFAYPAAVLRFVGYPLDWKFRERLQAVLDVILRLGKWPSTSPLPELDALYSHIMRQIPEDILPSALLLLCNVVLNNGDLYSGNPTFVSFSPLDLGFSESMFRDICGHLHAVITCQRMPESLSSLGPPIDLARSFYDQGGWFRPSISFSYQLLGVHGLFGFYHKSFYDFLIDPTRSSTFCITTPVIRTRLLDRLVQQHHRCALSYVVEGSKLSLAPGVSSSSASLSWPQGSEFIDSFFKLRSFTSVDSGLYYDDPVFLRLTEGVPLHTLRRLAELDFCKSLIAHRMTWDLPGWPNTIVVGVPGIARVLSHTIFERICTNKFDAFKPVEFLSMVDKLKNAGVIRPYHPRFGSGRAASILNTFSRKKSVMSCCGLYKLGHGEKSIIWYWEFDMEKRYFQQFETMDYEAATEFYKANKFTMWKGEGTEDDSEDGDRNWSK